MAVTLPTHPSTIPPHKRRRRTATSVFAGDFDPRPPRDVLTSLLNGVPRYAPVESGEDLKRERRKDKKARERVKKRAKSAQDEPVNGELGAHLDTVPPIADAPLHAKDFLFDPSSSSSLGFPAGVAPRYHAAFGVGHATTYALLSTYDTGPLHLL
jgi:hypothetical protein